MGKKTQVGSVHVCKRSRVLDKGRQTKITKLPPWVQSFRSTEELLAGPMELKGPMKKCQVIRV